VVDGRVNDIKAVGHNISNIPLGVVCIVVICLVVITGEVEVSVVVPVYKGYREELNLLTLVVEVQLTPVTCDRSPSALSRFSSSLYQGVTNLLLVITLRLVVDVY
jgi:hypothetical protein